MPHTEPFEETPTPSAGLLARIRADPVHAPESIALAAAKQHGPAAARWRAAQRGDHGARLARRAKRVHARMARLGGAAMGLGGWITMLPDIASVGWIQSRMVFYIAAAYGYDPVDPMRPAEYLALRGFYPDPLSARAALDGVGTTVAEQYLSDSLSGSEEKLLTRLTRLTVRKGGARLAGRTIPGFAIAFNALTNERETRAVAKEAMKFYGG